MTVLCYNYIQFIQYFFLLWIFIMVDHSSPEHSPWGWKALIVAVILGCFFMGFFYLAVTNEPDYMPSQQQKNTQQHAFKNAPAMSPEAMQAAQANQQKANATQQPDQPSTETSTAPGEHIEHSHGDQEHSH